jgi:autotransporter-associated beta strand protein
VIPWAYANADVTNLNPRNLVTPDGNGLRPLADTEFDVVGANGNLVSHTNNLLNNGSPAPIAAGAAVQVNSLRIDHQSGGSTTIGGGPGSTLQVYSGAIVNFFPATFNVPTLDFGPRTGYFHFGDQIVVNSTITGSAGVVASSSISSQTLTLAASNPFTGGLTINGRATVQYTADNQLGATGGQITFGGGTLSYNGTGPITLNRPVVLTPAGGALSVSDANSVLTFDTTNTTGTGNLIIAGVGTVALAGTNNSSGGTIVSSATLRVTSAGSLGSGPLTLNTGTLQLASAATPFAKDIVVNQASAIDVGTLNPTISGVISTLGTGGVIPSLTKTGSGTLTLTGNNTYTGSLSVLSGGLTLSGGGQLPNVTTLFVANGTVFTLDDTTTNLGNRLAGPISLSGGNVVVQGNAAASSTASFGTLSATSGTSFLSLRPGSGSPVQVTSASFNSAGGLMVFRGTGLGGTGANTSQVFFGTAPVLVGGLISGAVGDLDPVNGSGSFFVSYNPTNGVVQAPAPTATNVIQNPQSGTTPVDANVLTVAPTTVAIGASNTINSLTLAPGSVVSSQTPPSSLFVTSGLVLSQAGSPSAINSSVGLNTGAAAGFAVITNGDLTISGGIVSGPGNFSKGGPGTLTLSSTSPYSFSGTLGVNGGTLVLGSNTSAARVGGAANLTLNSGVTLTVTGAPQTIAAQVGGAGSLFFNPLSVTQYTLAGTNSFSGGTTGSANAIYALTNPAGFGTGPVTLTNTLGTSNTLPVIGFDFGPGGSGTLPNAITLSTATGIDNVLSALNSAGQTITLSGKISGGEPTAFLVIDESGISQSNIFRLTNSGNDFQGTVRVDFGTLAITSNGALGNANNGLTLQSSNPPQGSLRFDAAGIDISRPVTVAGSGPSINTNGNNATISGVLAGSAPLTKFGAGSLTLSNAGNTHTGPVNINGGALLVTGALAASANPVTVNSGGTLGGTGTINRPVTVNNGGTLAPGTSPGILTINGAVTLTAGSTFAVELNGTTPGNGATNYDQLVLGASGTINLGGATLTATSNSNALPGSSLTIITGPANSIANGSTFANLPNGGQLVLPNSASSTNPFYLATINYNYAGGTVVLSGFTPVPEPAHLLALCGAAVGAAGWVRRRRRGTQAG